MAAVKKSSKKRSKTPSKGFDKTRFKKTPTGPRKVSRYKATGPLKKELRKNAATKVPVRKKQQRRAPGDEELSLPAMNKITPAGVQKPTGKKKGKVFVEDPVSVLPFCRGLMMEVDCFQESMMTILAMVTAEKEGHIESKMVKARQMEEIREARRKEQERKEAIKKQKFEEVKDGLRKKRRRKQSELSSVHEHLTDDANGGASKSKKRVSFA